MTTLNTMKNLPDAMDMLSGLLNCLKYSRSNPCTNRKDDKECADRDIPWADFCPRCVKVWTDAGALDGMTGEEAYKSMDAK